LIWYADEPDGVYIDQAGYAPTFPDDRLLVEYARVHGLAPISIQKPVLHDLDSAERFAGESTAIQFDCPEILKAWNLFGDFAHSLDTSLGASFRDFDETLNPVYDKVFRCCNLPAMTPKSEEYHPVWSAGEIDRIQELLKVGFALFRSAVRPFSAGEE